MNIKRTLLLLTGLLTYALISCSAYEVGDTINDLSLYNSDGEEVSLYDFTGIPIIIEIWTHT